MISQANFSKSLLLAIGGVAGALIANRAQPDSTGAVVIGSALGSLITDRILFLTDSGSDEQEVENA